MIWKYHKKPARERTGHDKPAHCQTKKERKQRQLFNGGSMESLWILFSREKENVARAGSHKEWAVSSTKEEHCTCRCKEERGVSLGKWFGHKSQDKVGHKCRLKLRGRRHQKQKSFQKNTLPFLPLIHCRRVVFSFLLFLFFYLFSIRPNRVD